MLVQESDPPNSGAIGKRSICFRFGLYRWTMLGKKSSFKYGLLIVAMMFDRSVVELLAFSKQPRSSSLHQNCRVALWADR